MELTKDQDTEMLLTCLKKSLEDETLAQDIYEACEINNITFMALAKGELSPAAAAETLFLTEEEAIVLFDVCAAELQALETGIPCTDVPRRVVHAVPVSEPNTELMEDGEYTPEATEQAITEGTTPELDAPQYDFDERQAVEQSDMLVDEPCPQPEADDEPDAPDLEMVDSPQTSSRSLAVPSAEDVEAPVPDYMLTPEAPNPVQPSGKKPALAASSPSYLKPTAVHAARASEAPSTAAPQLQRKNSASRVPGTFLMPTQASLSRSQAAYRDGKENMGSSQHLKAVLERPQGQRITSPKPFMLKTDSRPKLNKSLTSDDMAMLRASEEHKALRYRPVPKAVKDPKPLPTRNPSKAARPEDIQKPFNLSSLERHEKMQAALKAKREEEARQAKEAHQFKARGLNKRIIENVSTPKRPYTPPPTKGVSPVFVSEERIKHYHEVVEPVKKAKEEEERRQKEEEERKAKEDEEMAVVEMRKSMTFKARTMPDFSSPFKPDPSLAASATVAHEFRLSTDERLGKPLPKSPGLRESQVIGGYRSVDGFVDPFIANLRASSGSPLSPKSGKNSPNALRKSQVKMMSQSTAGVPVAAN